MTPDTWKELFNYGVPTALICFFGFAVWRIIKFMGKALFDDAHGVVVRYVSKHEEFLDGLAKRDAKQQELCGRHATLLADLNTMMMDRTPILQATAEGIKRLVELSEAKHSPISTITLQKALPAFKQAAIEHCQICRKIVRNQMPSLEIDLNVHLDAIEEVMSKIEE